MLSFVERLLGFCIALFLILVALGIPIFLAIGFSLAVEESEDSTPWAMLSTSVFVFLAVAAAIPAWWLGVPPEPTIILQHIDLVLCVQIAALYIGIGAIIWLLYIGSTGGWLRKVLALAAQPGIVVGIFLLSFLWTMVDARRTALATRLVDPVDIQAGPSSVPAGSVSIAHISDLHITSDAGPTREGPDPGNNELPQLIRAIVQQHPKYLVVTGDITDSGAPREWENAMQALREISSQIKILLVPGNHDVNLWFGTEPDRDSYTDGTDLMNVGFAEVSRLGRLLLAQAELFPELQSRTGRTVADIATNAPGSTSPPDLFKNLESQCWDDCLASSIGETGSARVGASFACSRECKKWPMLREYYYLSLLGAFPLMYVDTENSLAFFVLASAAPGEGTNYIGRQAIGHISDAQIDGLLTELGNIPSTIRRFVFLLHHPITNPRGEDDSLRNALGDLPAKIATDRVRATWRHFEDSVLWARAFLRTNPDDSRRLLTAIHDEMVRRGSEGILMFGHRHVRTLGRWDNLTFVEAPNVSPSAEHGFFSVTFTDGPTGIVWHSY